MNFGNSISADSRLKESLFIEADWRLAAETNDGIDKNFKFAPSWFLTSSTFQHSSSYLIFFFSFCSVNNLRDYVFLRQRELFGNFLREIFREFFP